MFHVCGVCTWIKLDLYKARLDERIESMLVNVVPVFRVVLGQFYKSYSKATATRICFITNKA